MAKEIDSLQDARDRLAAMFGEKLGERRDAYATIAWRLTNTVELTALANKLSEALWRKYNELPPDATNRLTRSIMAHASAAHGFSDHTSIVLAGEAGSAVGRFLKSKALWKDSVNIRHGEYTHSLQWLTAGLDMGGGLSELYAKTGVLSKIKIHTRVSHADAEAPEVVWTWLVDCRPNDGKSEKIRTEEGIFSNSCRAPELATKFFRGLEGSFIAYVLNARHDDKLRGFAKLPSDKSSDPAFQQYARERHQASMGWTPTVGALSPEPVIFERKNTGDWAGHKERGGAPLNPKSREGIEKTFHGISGRVSHRP